MDLRNPALAQVTPQEKIDRVLAMEKLVKESDPRIDKTAHNVINTGSYTVRIVNSHGMDRSYTEDVCALYGQATAKDGDFVSSGGYGVAARSFDELDARKVGGEVAAARLTGSTPRRAVRASTGWCSSPRPCATSWACSAPSFRRRRRKRACRCSRGAWGSASPRRA